MRIKHLLAIVGLNACLLSACNQTKTVNGIVTDICDDSFIGVQTIDGSNWAVYAPETDLEVGDIIPIDIDIVDGEEYPTLHE